MKDIFESIAQASGGSSETIGSKTQVRDVVSSSFTLPEGATADDITYYTMDIDPDGMTWINQQVPAGVTPVIGKNDSGNSTLTVEGFDYSKDDSSEGAGDGNWVGIRYRSNGAQFYAGKKLVIQFNIAVNGEATGGVGTNTNTAESGVYVYDEETGTYTCVNNYDVPHTTLPINLKISKTGLRHGESATFEIQRTRPLRKDADGNIIKWNDELTLEENTANMYYNAIGKPVPDASAWKTFSKVVVTNTGTDWAEVKKNLLALDPNWVYQLLEDDWGWSYNMTGEGTTMTTSEVEENPFKFKNEEKKDAPKHAEAVSINHFATSASGTATEEHYSSSKVTSF